MNNSYETFTELTVLKEEIKSLGPLEADANYLEHLLQNAMEIMHYNNVDISKVQYTYEKEMSHLLECQINSKRIAYFEQVQAFAHRQIPFENLLIQDIPEEWLVPPVVRVDRTH